MKLNLNEFNSAFYMKQFTIYNFFMKLNTQEKHNKEKQKKHCRETNGTLKRFSRMNFYSMASNPEFSTWFLLSDLCTILPVRLFGMDV